MPTRGVESVTLLAGTGGVPGNSNSYPMLIFAVSGHLEGLGVAHTQLDRSAGLGFLKRQRYPRGGTAIQFRETYSPRRSGLPSARFTVICSERVNRYVAAF